MDCRSSNQRLFHRGGHAPLRLVAMLAVCSLLLAGGVPPAAADGLVFEPNPRPHSVVIDWVDAALQAAELNPPAPTATTRRLWVMASSMHDAWAAYDGAALATQSGFDLKRPAAERTLANKNAAISYAAHRALSAQYPGQVALFDDVMSDLGYPLSTSTDVTTPEGIGNVAAQAVIDDRANDGSNAIGGFTQIPSATFPDLYAPVNSADPAAPNGIFGPDFNPNRWQPLRVPNGTAVDENGDPIAIDADPTTYSDQKFLTPHWGAVTPFALTSGDQFRPSGPPLFGSDEPYVDALGNTSTNHQAWIDQMNEIVEFSAGLTDEHKVIAEFWADGPKTWTPPGHWLQLAQGISLRDGHDVDQDVRMYLALSGAVLDAGISAWEAKRIYDCIRPISAIRHYHAGQTIESWGGPNQGTRLIDGSDWRPYQSLTFVTPAFAEFTSGHSTFSRASREVLYAFAGTDAMYDGVTLLGRDYDGNGNEDYFGEHVAVPGTLTFEEGPEETVVLQWDTLLDAADEAGWSRRYGGIHFQDGDLQAREAGRKIGQQAYQFAELFWDPFGEMRRTVDELVASEDVTRQAGRALVAKLRAAQKAFAAGNSTVGCTLLDSVDKQIERQRGGAVSETAYQRLDRQVETVSGLLCD